MARRPQPVTERIERLDDPRVADFRNVKDARLREDAGLFLAEGRLGVRRLITGRRFRTRSVFVTDTAETLVLLEAGREVRRVPLALEPGEQNVLEL